MKKLLIGLAIASALGLSGCDDETIADIEKENNEVSATGTSSSFGKASRVRFDPAAGDVAPPNDLMFIDTQDGTLNIPLNGGDPTDFSNPFVAANALDGWSTNQPFVLNFEFADGVSLDPASLFDIGAVAIYEVVLGASIDDADCAAVAPLVGCKPVEELILTEDYFVQAMGSSLAIIPLKPLKPRTSYIVALTNKLKDTNGESINGSVTYNIIKQDIETAPLSDPQQAGLQQLTNSYENIAEGFGLNKEDIIYTMTMTTQSVGDVLNVTKQLLAASLTENALFAPPSVIVEDTTLTAADALNMMLTELGAAPLSEDQFGLYSTAKLYSGKVSIPNYFTEPSMENPMAPINVPWKALCDSGVTLAGLSGQIPEAIPAEPQSKDDGVCMALSGGALRETSNWDLSAYGIDTPIDKERNLTKYNSIPKVAEELQTVDVQMTVPDIDMVNYIRVNVLGLEEISTPENGWPVAILAHGFTRNKEFMLPVTAALSLNGIASVAIDHPLHGSRGYDLDMDGNMDIEAGANPFAYMNIGALLQMRDNVKQSVTDTLALRLGLNFSNAPIDATQVHYLGHSLGAMTGVNFLALTNTPLDPMVDPLFAIQNASLVSPTGGAANVVMDSPSFGPLAKFSLAYSQSADFKAAVDGVFGEAGPTPDQMEAFWNDFVASENPALGELNGAFEQFVFAAQTITDSADMMNYAKTLVDTGTPLHTIEIVGDDMDNLSDQGVVTSVASAPLAGSTPLIDQLLKLSTVSETTMVEEGTISGAVKFLNGHHNSLVWPGTRPESMDAELSARATQEMQMQIATYFASGAKAIVITDEAVVK
ncbi:lipase [Thalassotalea psychrophila]|uniref:Lipase n=1 Tax=Thalassotalea psychrophila TaxID=3065647 RepID=A0ABY9TQA3_9GAMM|nr:lipase [Colwelliaceae bacterium SQ149]